MESDTNKLLLSVQTTDEEFYKKAQTYWDKVPATINGMLGGLGFISTIDIQGSKQFLNEIENLGNGYALDCGAGIGRVAKNLLMPNFNIVDLVEQNTIYAQMARNFCTEGKAENNRIGDVYNIGLQEFYPCEKKYDLIWCQWVLGHLTDIDLVQFFTRIRKGLKKTGYFVMKENVTSTNEVEKDDEDSSFTRPLKNYEEYLKKTDLYVFKTIRQVGFPKGLYPVYMIACKPFKDVKHI